MVHRQKGHRQKGFQTKGPKNTDKRATDKKAKKADERAVTTPVRVVVLYISDYFCSFFEGHSSF